MSARTTMAELVSRIEEKEAELALATEASKRAAEVAGAVQVELDNLRIEFTKSFVRHIHIPSLPQEYFEP